MHQNVGPRCLYYMSTCCTVCLCCSDFTDITARLALTLVSQVPGLSPLFLNSAMLKIIFWNWISSEIFFPSYTLMSRQPIHFFQAVHSLSWQKEVHFRCCIDGTETDRTLNLVFIFQNQIKVSLQFCFVSNAIICEQHVDQGSFVLLSKLMRNLPAPLNQWLESLRISHTATSCCILCFTLSREQSNHFAMGI